jgi:hypothetical protein
MIDIDLYKTLFDKYSFEIHEWYEGGCKHGKLKKLFYDMKTLPCNSIKYTTDLGYIIYHTHECIAGDPRMTLKIKDIEISNYKIQEVLKMYELERKYY